jgi:hypothetical protein
VVNVQTMANGANPVLSELVFGHQRGILCRIIGKLDQVMFDPQSAHPPARNRDLLPGTGQSQEPDQRRLMQAALLLLLACLAVVLYRDRDFWFPDAGEDVAQQTLQGSSGTLQGAQKIRGHQEVSGTNQIVTRRKLTGHQAEPAAAAVQSPNSVPPTTVTRTVLPQLEVEVVAGSNHRTLRPGSSSLRIDLEPEEGSESKQASSAQMEIPAAITTNAAERRFGGG